MLVLFTGCDQVLNNQNADNTILAEAYGEKLSVEDISEHLKNAQTYSDTQFVLSRYTDQWVMDKILFEEAKKTVGKKESITELVKEYERSLIIHEWDKEILASELDTFLNAQEISNFYEERKSEFKLQEDIVRFLFISVVDSMFNGTMEDLWKTEEIPALKQYVSEARGNYILNPDEWHYKSEMKNIFPSALFNKISFSRPNNYSLSENESKYFVKIIETVDSDQDAPVTFVEDIIRQRILHDRAKALLKQKKAALFDKNIQNKIIKIYSKEDS